MLNLPGPIAASLRQMRWYIKMSSMCRSLMVLATPVASPSLSSAILPPALTSAVSSVASRSAGRGAKSSSFNSCVREQVFFTFYSYCQWGFDYKLFFLLLYSACTVFVKYFIVGGFLFLQRNIYLIFHPPSYPFTNSY